MFSKTPAFAQFVALFVLLSLSSLSSAQKSCKALVLEGGGDKGAYEAGVLYGWIKNTQTPEDFQYDVVTGISIGAINAMGIGQFPKGQEDALADFLQKTWQEVDQRDVFVSWPGGLIQGLFFERSLFNNDNELGFLNSLVTKPVNQRRITVAATDFATGEKVLFSEQDWGTNITLATNAALYSSSVPVVFSYRNYGDQILIDGGWSGEGLDIEDAVFRCREIVDSDDQITIDVIFATNNSLSEITKSSFNTFQIYTRSTGIHSYASSTLAYSYGRDAYPDVNFRYVMIASERLPDQDLPLDFKQENIQFMFNLGIQDAVKSLGEEPGVTAKQIYDLSVQFQDDLFFNTGQY